MNCAFIIESLVYDILKLTLESPINSTIEGRSIGYLLKRARSGSWSQLVEVYETTFDFSINSNVNDELWKDVMHLFGFRNHLVHGKPMIINSDIAGAYTYSESNLDRLSKFISERGLMESGNARTPLVGIVNSKIADYFWNSTKEFCICLSEFHAKEHAEIVNKMFKDALDRSES